MTMTLRSAATTTWRRTKRASTFVYRTAKAGYGRYYAWKHRPPSEAETQAALNEMKAALHSIDAYFQHTGYFQMQHLNGATKSLQAARRLNKNVVLHDEHGTAITLDSLSARILRIESEYWKLQFDHRVDHALNLAREGTRYDRSGIEEAKRKMIVAAHKSLRYDPNNIQSLIHLASLHVDLLQKHKARKVLRHILKLDPNNVEALAMRRR